MGYYVWILKDKQMDEIVGCGVSNGCEIFVDGVLDEEASSTVDVVIWEMNDWIQAKYPNYEFDYIKKEIDPKEFEDE